MKSIDTGLRKIVRHRPLQVMINVITLWSFLFSIVGGDLAWAAKTPTEPTRVGSDRAGGLGIPLDLDNVSVPLRFGEIKETFKGSNGKTIIHIQDAHCNYAAQTSIDGMIRHLTDTYNNVSLLSLEGGKGNYDLSIFTDIKDAEIRRKVADYFVKEGRVSGPEFFAINNPDKVTLFGIEDENLYRENLGTYRNSLAYKEEADKSLNTLSTAIANLKMKIYSPELKEIDAKMGEYKDNKIGFKEYIVFLTDKAKSAGIDIKQYKGIAGLISVLNDEKEINFREADRERNKLIDKINEKLSKRNLEELVIKSAQFKVGDITSEEFYSYLFKKAEFSGVDFSKLPNLVKYSEYVKRYEALDRSAIFKEVKAIEEALSNKAAKTEDQKTLYSLDKDLAIIKGMLGIQLTKDEFDYYRTDKDEFAIKRFVDFINTKAPLYGLNFKLNNGIEKIDSYRENMEKFYVYSLKRDDAFIKNIEKKLKDEDKDITILVTGGFHTGNLAKLFKDKGYTYIEVMPKFGMTDIVCPYMKLLSGQKTDIASVLESSVSLGSNKSTIAIQSLFSQMGMEDVRARNGFNLEVEIAKKVFSTPKGTPVEFWLRLQDGRVILITNQAIPQNADSSVESGEWRAGLFVKNLPAGKTFIDIDAVLVDGDKMTWEQQEFWDKVGISVGTQRIDSYSDKNWAIREALKLMGLSDAQIKAIMDSNIIMEWNKPLGMGIKGHPGGSHSELDIDRGTRDLAVRSLLEEFSNIEPLRNIIEDVNNRLPIDATREQFLDELNREVKKITKIINVQSLIAYELSGKKDAEVESAIAVYNDGNMDRYGYVAIELFRLEDMITGGSVGLMPTRTAGELRAALLASFAGNDKLQAFIDTFYKEGMRRNELADALRAKLYNMADNERADYGEDNLRRLRGMIRATGRDVDEIFLSPDLFDPNGRDYEVPAYEAAVTLLHEIAAANGSLHAANKKLEEAYEAFKAGAGSAAALRGLQQAVREIVAVIQPQKTFSLKQVVENAPDVDSKYMPIDGESIDLMALNSISFEATNAAEALQIANMLLKAQYNHDAGPTASLIITTAQGETVTIKLADALIFGATGNERIFSDDVKTKLSNNPRKISISLEGILYDIRRNLSQLRNMDNMNVTFSLNPSRRVAGEKGDFFSTTLTSTTLADNTGAESLLVQMNINQDIEQYRKWQQEGVKIEIRAGNQLDSEVHSGKIRLITNVATGYPIIWLEGNDFGIYLKDIIKVVLPGGQTLVVKDQNLISSASKWDSLQQSGRIISGNSEVLPSIPAQHKERLKKYVHPIAVANLPNDGVVVADSTQLTYGAGISMPDGSFIPLLDEGGQPLTEETVKMMTTDDLGYIYVATASSKKTGMGKIRKYSQDGILSGGYDVSYGKHKAGYGVNIQGMVAFENKLYYTITDFGEFRVLDLSTGMEKVFGGPEAKGPFMETRSMGLSVDRQNRTVLIVDSGYAGFKAGGMAFGDAPMRIRKFIIDSEEYGKPQELPGMFGTGGLSIDGNGIVYISDSERNIVHIYSISEGYQGYIPTFRGVSSIGIDNNGNLMIGRSGGFDIISQEAISQLLVRVNNGTSMLSANLPFKALPNPNPINPNVSCGTICENGHEGSYAALDEQLQRQFNELRNVYNNQVPSQVKQAVSRHFGISVRDRIAGSEKLTEIETDLANVFSGYLSQEEFVMLQSIRNTIKETDAYKRATQKTGKEIEIFFTRPETSTELFWHGTDYAAGHFNKLGTRIHISLPLAIRDAHEMFLSRSRGFAVPYTVVSAAVAQHELTHITENKHDGALDNIIKTISERDIKRGQINNPSIATFGLPNGSRLEMATVSEYNKPIEDMDKLHQITREGGWHSVAVSIDSLPKDLLELFAAIKVDAEGKVSMLDVLKMSTDEIIFAPHLSMYNQAGEKMMYSVGEMILNPFELYDRSIRPGKRILFVGTLIPSDAIRTGEQIHARDIVEISHYIARAIGRRITQQLVAGGMIGNDYLNNNNLFDRNSWAMERQFLLAFSQILTQNRPEHKKLIERITRGHKIDDIVRLNLQGQFLSESEMMIRSNNGALAIPSDYMDIPPDLIQAIVAGTGEKLGTGWGAAMSPATALTIAATSATFDASRLTKALTVDDLKAWLAQLKSDGISLNNVVFPDSLKGEAAVINIGVTQHEWNNIPSSLYGVSAAGKAFIKKHKLGENVTINFFVNNKEGVSEIAKKAADLIKSKTVRKDRIVTFAYTEPAADGTPVEIAELKDASLAVVYMNGKDGEVATPVQGCFQTAVKIFNFAYLKEKGATDELPEAAMEISRSITALTGVDAAPEKMQELAKKIVEQGIASVLLFAKLRPVDVNAIADFHKAEAEVLRAL